MAELLKGKPLFAGNSTLNQLEKLLSWTGNPSHADIQALESDVGWSMIENLRGIKQKSIREWLPNADELALDLISKMLQFNPKKRITIEEVLKHPYLRDFHNPANEIISRPIRPVVDDNKKLSLKDYRSLIYKEISKRCTTEKSKGPDIAKCEIRCELPANERPKKKSLREKTQQNE